jgi:peptidoglycan/LPS O-acetylase OafA/YrhL
MTASEKSKRGMLIAAVVAWGLAWIVVLQVTRDRPVLYALAWWALVAGGPTIGLFTAKNRVPRRSLQIWAAVVVLGCVAFGFLGAAVGGAPRGYLAVPAAYLLVVVVGAVVEQRRRRRA